MNINPFIERDQFVQYLAFYTATKGLLVDLDVELMKKTFSEYKMHLKKNEYTVDWLAKQVMDKYGIPGEKPQLDGMVIAPVDIMNELLRGYTKNDPRLSSQLPQHDKTATSTLEPPDLEILKKMEQKLRNFVQKNDIPIPSVKKHRGRPKKQPPPALL